MKERKYKIEGDRLVKRSDGVPIPYNEPLFILRAKDINALPALMGYVAICISLEHREQVMKSVLDFKEFATKNPELMKEPTA